ncbi:MAG: hypothetical protein J5846_09545, partial [Desulfovibrio sp.]|nr:hypothetical protein [Desulfovibrio sp.]
DSQKRSDPWLPADEWVGEPTHVAKHAESSSKPEMPSKDLDSQKRSDSWLPADEWVGEPRPVAKAASLRETQTQTENAHAAGDDHSVPHKSNWAADWEGERIPVLVEAEKEERKASEKNLRHDAEESEGKTNVLDFIEGAVETDDLNGTFVSLSEQKSTANDKTGIAPDPALLDLVRRLNIAVEDAKRALAASQSMRVAEAAGRIAAECDAFSFRILARIARCVEQAGKARDLNALKDLLPELAQQVERNNIALTQIR